MNHPIQSKNIARLIIQQVQDERATYMLYGHVDFVAR